MQVSIENFRTKNQITKNTKNSDLIKYIVAEIELLNFF